MFFHSKKYFSLSFIFIPFFVLSCASSRYANEPAPKSVLLTTSDTPEFFQAFTKSLAIRINKEKLFSAQENPVLSEQWINNFHQAQGNDNKNKLVELVNEVKNTYQSKPIRDAKLKSQWAMDEAEKILLNNYTSLSKEYAELAFWVAVVNFDEPANLQFPASLYRTLANKKERMVLEEQTSPKIVSMIEKSGNKLANVKIKTRNSCAFYSNGQLLTKSTFKAILGGKNILTAQCNTGNYAQVFNSEKISHISIFPVMNVVENNPPPSTLPVAELEKLKLDSAILIYNSTKEKYIDVNVYDVKNKKFYPNYKLSLNSDSDKKNAENLLIKYLKKVSYSEKESLVKSNKK